jgi:hypothetical protein
MNQRNNSVNWDFNLQGLSGGYGEWRVVHKLRVLHSIEHIQVVLPGWNVGDEDGPIAGRAHNQSFHVGLLEISDDGLSVERVEFAGACVAEEDVDRERQLSLDISLEGGGARQGAKV